MCACRCGCVCILCGCVGVRGSHSPPSFPSGVLFDRHWRGVCCLRCLAAANRSVRLPGIALVGHREVSCMFLHFPGSLMHAQSHACRCQQMRIQTHRAHGLGSSAGHVTRGVLGMMDRLGIKSSWRMIDHLGLLPENPPLSVSLFDIQSARSAMHVQNPVVKLLQHSSHA